MTSNPLPPIILCALAGAGGLVCCAASQDAPERLLSGLEEISSQRRPAQASVRLVSLISPGYHCPASLSAADLVDEVLAEFPDRAMQHLVVADGRHTAKESVKVYAEHQNPDTTVLFDHQSRMRSELGLSELPMVIGLDSSDRVLFVLPLPNGLARQSFRLQIVGVLRGLFSERRLWIGTTR